MDYGASPKQKTYELDRTDFGDTTVVAGVKQIEYEARIKVPMDMHGSSYSSPRNQVRWALQVTVHIPRVAKDTSHFVVKVLSV